MNSIKTVMFFNEKQTEKEKNIQYNCIKNIKTKKLTYCILETYRIGYRFRAFQFRTESERQYNIICANIII